MVQAAEVDVDGVVDAAAAAVDGAPAPSGVASWAASLFSDGALPVVPGEVAVAQAAGLMDEFSILHYPVKGLMWLTETVGAELALPWVSHAAPPPPRTALSAQPARARRGPLW